MRYTALIFYFLLEICFWNCLILNKYKRFAMKNISQKVHKEIINLNFDFSKIKQISFISNMCQK